MKNNSQEKKMRKYIVTGAAGHLGSTIIRKLIELDYEVSGLLLPGETPKVIGKNITYHIGDVCDINSLQKLFQEDENKEIYLIHTAALISIANKIPPKVHEVNVGGVKNILKLCEEKNVKKLVYVCSVHAIPELPKGQIMKEPDSFSPELVNGGYAKTKAEAAQAVLDATKKGLNAVIVLPSGIIGPYDDGGNHLIQMISEYMHGKLPACVIGGYDFVDVRDVALGCILAAEYGKSGQSYILSGTNLKLKDLLKIAGKYCDRKPIPAIPIWSAKLVVPFVSVYSHIRDKRPLYTSYSLTTLSGNSLFSNDKAKQELHYTVRDIEETVRDMVEWIYNISKKS